MLKYSRDSWNSHVLLLTVVLGVMLLPGCSERRKEAARLEAELEAHRSGASSTGDISTQSESTDILPGTELANETTTEETSSSTDSQLSVQDGGVDSSSSDSVALSETPVSAEYGSAGVPQEPPTDSIVMPARPRDGYTVQIAGTRSSEEADAIVERFKLYGYDAYVAEVSRDGRPFYRVRVGRFETEQEAIALKSQLLEQQQIEGWVDQGSW